MDGGELYVHLWQPEGWSIQTEAEQFGLTQVDIELPAVHTDCLLLQALANAVRSLAGEIVLQAC